MATIKIKKYFIINYARTLCRKKFNFFERHLNGLKNNWEIYYVKCIGSLIILKMLVFL